MLCSICTDNLQGRTAPIVLQSLENPSLDSKSFPYHSTAQSLRESAGDNCFICRRVWSQLVSLVPGGSLAQKSRAIVQGLETPRLTISSLHDSYGTNVFEIMFTRPDGFLLLSSFLLQPLSSYKRQPEASKASLEDRSPSSTNFPQISDTSSKESMDQARVWIRQCVSSHSKCNKSVNSDWSPTRVLDVGKKPSTSLRLICTAEEPLNGRYVTLSHCWGKHEFIKLLKSNIKEFRRNIPFSDLPNTFRDAIMVAQEFGIRYIWIDSLCILQDKDDLSDWYKEAGLMQQVYSCSYLNIAASAAADGSEGLFRARDSSTLQPEIVQYRDLSRVEDTEPTPCILFSSSLWTDLESTPLNKRGWVFQERLLAPRVLHFGHSELVWECCEFEASEIFPCGIPGSVWSMSYPGKTAKSSFFNVDQASELQGPKLWGRIVQCFSQTVLTVSTDKLVALSGVAKQFREFIRDDYVAGMWRKDLDRQLMWSTRASAAPIPFKDSNSLYYCYPSQYLAPTWSWASVDTIIYPVFQSGMSPLLAVEDVQLSYVTDDTTSAVTSGHVGLKGTLLPFDVNGKLIVTFSPDYSIFSDGHLLSNTSPGTDLGNSVVFGADDVTYSDRALIATKAWYGDCRVLLDDLNLTYDKDKVWCLFGIRFDSGDVTTRLVLRVLLLEEVERQHGIFRRIGIAIKTSPDRKQPNMWTEDGWWNDIRVDSAAAQRFPCRKYIEEEGKHVVRVI